MDLPQLLTCRACPRLVRFRADLPPKKGYTAADYWRRPVPGFGDPHAALAIVGLAPGAHGANRTGRPFTGDGAGDFMYPLLHDEGLATAPRATARDDGLELRGLYLTNAVKCLPPENQPKAEEFAACRPLLAAELERLPALRVLLLLGAGAYRSYLRLLKDEGRIDAISSHPFAHGAHFRPPGGPWVVASNHPSRYNIQTRRLDAGMFLAVLRLAKALAGGEMG